MTVPADYLGAFANSNRVYDLWVANSPENAQLGAKLLNRALSEKYGHTAEAASAAGVLIVAASKGTETESTQADRHRIQVAGACTSALPKPAP